MVLHFLILYFPVSNSQAHWLFTEQDDINIVLELETLAVILICLPMLVLHLITHNTGFDVLTSESIHAEVLTWTIWAPSLVLIAPVVFLLDYGHTHTQTHRHTKSQMPLTSDRPTTGMDNYRGPSKSSFEDNQQSNSCSNTTPGYQNT